MRCFSDAECSLKQSFTHGPFWQAKLAPHQKGTNLFQCEIPKSSLLVEVSPWWLSKRILVLRYWKCHGNIKHLRLRCNVCYHSTSWCGVDQLIFALFFLSSMTYDLWQMTHEYSVMTYHPFSRRSRRCSIAFKYHNQCHIGCGIWKQYYTALNAGFHRLEILQVQDFMSLDDVAARMCAPFKKTPRVVTMISRHPPQDLKYLTLLVARRWAPRHAKRAQEPADCTCYRRINAALRRHTSCLQRKQWPQFYEALDDLTHHCRCGEQFLFCSLLPLPPTRFPGWTLRSHVPLTP